MLSKDEIYDVLNEAFEATQAGGASVVAFSRDLKLVGRDGVLDSLDAMLFLDAVDDALGKRVGRQITLTEGDAFSRQDNPFASMESLAEYIQEVLGQE